MLPCEYLWAWLGAQLKDYTSNNLYASWITGNDYPDGAYAMGNFLMAYQKEHSIDVNLANQIYRQAMEFEFHNFEAAM
jgi:thiaminase/transcriptional activator TenA